MTIQKMEDVARRSASRLENISNFIKSSVHVIERILKLEEYELEVKSWNIIDGILSITFQSSVELEHELTDKEGAVVDTLKRIFPNAIIEGTCITIRECDFI